jgi:hypothetical protein
MASDNNAGKTDSPAAATPATDKLRSLLLPLARSYVRAHAAKPADGLDTGAAGASSDDNETLRLAGRKLLVELGDVVTQKYPVLPEGATLNVKPHSDGYFGDLSVTHVLSAAKLVQSIFAAPLPPAPEQPAEEDMAAQADTSQVARAYVITQTPMDVRLVREVVLQRKQVPGDGGVKTLSKSAAPAVKSLQKSTAQDKAAATTTPSGDCGSWSISCETRERLMACLKQAICDFLRCMEGQICVNGQFNQKAFTLSNLLDCLSPAACTLIHCIPDAICPPVSNLPTLPETDLVCDFAVEEPGQ